MGEFKIERRKLELTTTWAIARSSNDVMYNYFVSYEAERLVGIGEVHPNARYEEHHDTIMSGFEDFLRAYNNESFTIEEFSEFLSTLDLDNSLRFGLESAYVHWHCRKTNSPVYKIFNLAIPTSVKTSLSIPMVEFEQTEKLVTQARRFKALKVKVDAESAEQRIKLISSLTDQPLRIDGNETWDDYDEFMKFWERVKDKNIEFMEQPFHEACFDEYEELKGKLDVPVIADESVVADVDFVEIKKQFDGVNIKLMKAGGYINAIKLLQQAKELGLKTMIGCMIETSLGISSAMQIADMTDYQDLDGFLFLKEDPYELMEEKFGQLYLKKKGGML